MNDWINNFSLCGLLYDIIVILVECGWLIGKICVKIIDFERIRRSCIKRRIVFDVDWWRIDFTNFKIHTGFTIYGRKETVWIDTKNVKY